MPKLWNGTIEEHRQAVQDAILDATAALVAEHGLASVTMSRIAEAAGIGRATLYKYFPDLDAILSAWHQRHIATHLAHLAALKDRPADVGDRLEAVLDTFATISHEMRRHGGELSQLLHGGAQVTRAQHQLKRLLADLLAEGAHAGVVRDDVAPDELAGYCLHALSAAGGLPSKVAVRRLVEVTLAGLRRPR